MTEHTTGAGGPAPGADGPAPGSRHETRANVPAADALRATGAVRAASAGGPAANIGGPASAADGPATDVLHEIRANVPAACAVPATDAAHAAEAVPANGAVPATGAAPATGAVPPTGVRRPSAMMRRVDRIAGAAAKQAVRRARRTPPPAVVERDVAVVVAEVVAEAPDAVGLRLVARGGGPLPAWRPGAHLDVVLPSGRVRQYSLCGDPADRRAYRIAVRRIAGGAGSAEVHALAPGDELVVRGPRNAFPFVAAPSYLFLAGGIGITPLAPMVRAAAAAGARWRLVHTGRDLASLPLSGALAARFPGRVLRRSDTARTRPASSAGVRAHHGAPPTAAELLADLEPGATVYCCGPPPMIDAVRAAVPADTPFHAERFSAPPVRGGAPFTVRLGLDGPRVPVPADRTALQAILELRPDLAYSCRQGFCGTCHVPVLRGTTVQDTAGPGRMALCVGRAADPEVVVDLRA